MFEPSPPESARLKVRDRLKDEYFLKRDEYLELCWQYNLPPRDLSLLLMGKREILPGDRITIIRLIIQLMDLEKLLGPDLIKEFLFAEDESHYLNSAIFRFNLH